MKVQQSGDLQALLTLVGTRLDGSPLAVMLDVDGTLSPIASTPQEAIVPPATRNAVSRLARLPNVAVALVSGRSAEDAWEIGGVPEAWVIGNHGFELRAPDGQVSVADAVRDFQPAIAEAARQLGPMADSIKGVLVESKRWTLSIHYRLVQSSALDAVIARAKEVAANLALRVTEGKKVIELRPPLRIDKGTASVAFAERAGALRQDGSAMYAGDDRTDEDAFRELRSHSRRAVTVRVAAPDHLTTQTTAEFTVASPDELRGLLEWLVARRSRGKGSD